jgi:predicted O-methyltransferase YrrM
MDVETLLAHPPSLHVDPEGRPVPFEADERMLRRIAAEVGDGSRTLETGAGLSTLVFAVSGCEHTCVVPFVEEVERIRGWCEANGVPTDRLRFETARSEDVVPRLAGDGPLDLVLIDGGHGFPTPFVDWWYAGRRLRVGGVLIVDDTHLWTGAVLRDFLAEQPAWEMVETLPMRAAVLRRVAEDPAHEEWVDQPYVRRRSFAFGARGRVRQAVRAVDYARREGLGALVRRARA